MSIAIETETHPDLRPVKPNERRQAFALLARAARPDRRQVVWATVGLAAAGALEAAGPIFGKHFIDEHLQPRSFDPWAVALLLGGYFASGCAASVLRYFQLVRLAAVAMRSVRRLRDRVYAHVLRLPIAFFDRATPSRSSSFTCRCCSRSCRG
jgi:ATP-binding cassette subfamily B multidrug efflux pump